MLKQAIFLSPAMGLAFIAKVQAISLPEDIKPLCDGSFTAAVEQSLGLPPSGSTNKSFPLSEPNPQPNLPQSPQDLTIQKNYPLSLDTAIELGLQRNQGIQLAKLQLQQNCLGRKQAEAALYPQVNLSASISNANRFGSFDPQAATYPLNTEALNRSQQETLFKLQQQQAAFQSQLQSDLNLLQSRLQQLSTQIQRSTFQQRLNTLQQRSITNAILPPVNSVPLLESESSPNASTSVNSAGGTGSFFNGGVSVAYEIFSFGRREATLKVSKKLIQNNALEVQRQLEELRQSITSAYYDIQQAQALISVAEGAVRQAAENLRILDLGEKAGVRTKFEVLQASVTLADVQQLGTQAKTLKTIAQRQLAERLNLPNGIDVELPSTAVEKTGTWSSTVEESIILALNNRVELPQNALQRDITDLQRRIIRSQQRPQLQGFAALDVADDLEDPVLGAYGYTVGVQMNLNFFDGGEVKAQERQLKKDLEILTQGYEQQKEGIRFEVEQSYFTLRANESNIEISEQAVAQAKEGVRLAQLRFDAGVGTTLEITRAQADLTQAEGNRIAAILGYNRSLAILERATGYAAQNTPSQVPPSSDSVPQDPSPQPPTPQDAPPPQARIPQAQDVHLAISQAPIPQVLSDQDASLHILIPQVSSHGDAVPQGLSPQALFPQEASFQGTSQR
jgi:outer membrane factor, OMF family